MSGSHGTPGGGDEAPFSFDPSSGELTGPEATTRLAPQPSSLLELLMERRGEVVSRDEIGGRLWPGGGADIDQGIAFGLREIRKGLEEAGCDPGLVETIPRRGYRLQALPTPGPDGGAANGDDVEDSDDAEGAGRGKGIAIGVAVVLLAVLVSTLLPSPRETPVVAVFEHRAEAPELTAAAGSLGSTLTAALTGALEDDAGIVGPTGTASLDGPDDVEGARELLGACMVVSGNVTPSGSDPVIVFTQIVRTSDRVHVWASVDTVPSAGAVGNVVDGIVVGVRDGLAGC